MSLRPIMDRVVIEPDQPLDKTPSGLVLPNVLGKQGAPETGTVLAAGPGRPDASDGSLVPPGVQAGDRVLFKRVGGQDWTADGKKLYLCRVSEVLGRVE